MWGGGKSRGPGARKASSLIYGSATRPQLTDRHLPHLERIPAEITPYGDSGDGFANCRDGFPWSLQALGQLLPSEADSDVDDGDDGYAAL